MSSTAVCDYHYQAAGKTWLVPELLTVQLPDGSSAITQAEIDRVHRAVANEICGDPGLLTFEELEFLCDTTGTTQADAARMLDVHKSTLSKWRHQGTVGRPLYSMFLKRQFWFKIFGPELARELASLETFRDDGEFLALAKARAISKHVTEPLNEVAA